MVNDCSFFKRLLPVSPCLLCLTPVASGQLCDPCRDDLPWLTSCCQRCCQPLPREGLCAQCLIHPPPYHAQAACRYEYPLPVLIRRLKFQGNVAIVQELSNIMLRSFEKLISKESDCCLLPMPLHWRRQWWRGFNQSLELARPLAKTLKLPMRTDLCRRRRATRPQTDLEGRQRRANVHNAFEVCTPAVPRHVIVIDDVLTSGHTAAALSHCLRRAGAERVSVWVLARAGST